MEGIRIQYQKPNFKKAMLEARRICSADMTPPITKQEIYQVYRSSKNSGMIVFRCTFTN